MRLCKLFAVTAVILLFTPASAFAADVFVQNGAGFPTIERISWPAVIAGLVVAMAAHMALSALGIGIGAAAVDPMNRRNPTGSVPTMLLFWMFASGLVALFVGGWVSGRMAGTIPFDSAIHGVITWALATVAMFLFATTSLGYIVGGMFRLLGQGVSAAAGAAASKVPEGARMAKDAIADNLPQFDWKSIKREAKSLLHSAAAAGNEESSAEKPKPQGRKNGDTGRIPDFDEDEVGELLQTAYGTVRETMNAADRDELIDVITSRTGVTKEEAGKTLDKWEKMYREAKKKYNELVEQAKQSAREAADAATSAISHVAIWTFAGLVFGVVVAAAGGNLGSTYIHL